MNKAKRLSLLLVISGVLIIVVGTFFMVLLPKMMQPPTNLWLGDGIFKTEVAMNDRDRTDGLTGATKLDFDKALLMIYPSEGNWIVSTKNMKISVDIVWLNSNKKVVYIVKNSPIDDLTYTSKTPAKYVIELPAGTVDSKAINLSKIASFTIDEKDVK